MLDTVHMTTEHLTKDEYALIIEQLQARYGVSTATGEVSYLHYVATIAAPLTGAQIRLMVRTAKWIKRPGEKQPYKVDGLFSFRVEASIHKVMHGHNVYGGPTQPQESLEWLIHLVSSLVGVSLPCLDHWYVDRLDIAESFDLSSLDNVRGWIRAKSLVVYPRRTLEFWGDLGFRAAGTVTTLKAYAKGPQFHAEGGYKALLQCRDAAYAFEVARIAERTLRCEVEIKSARWDSLEHGGKASMISCDYLQEVYDEEWRKLLRPIDSDSRMVHTAVEVYNRLSAEYGQSCLTLYMVWCILAIRGEAFYRTQVAASTWRKQRALLEKAYVSWHSTNILTIDAPESIIDFVPLRSALQRITEILPLTA